MLTYYQSIYHRKNSNSIEFNAIDIMLSHLVMSLLKLVATTTTLYLTLDVSNDDIEKHLRAN